MQIAVGDGDGAVLRAYVSSETGRAVGNDPIWIGWEPESTAVLAD